MAKAKYIVIPVRTEALFVPEDMYVANQEMDFTELPYFNRFMKRDENDDIPFTSESIGAQEFSSLQLKLMRGIHLHWTLPQPAAKGIQKDGDMDFPAIPNRWLVTRTYQGEKRQWIVESDYLHEGKRRLLGQSIAIPYPPDEEGLPYRFMGRTYPLEAWKQKEQFLSPEGIPGMDAATANAFRTALGNPEYFKTARLFQDEKDPEKGLTVLGYGNDKFTTFYPNCYSVLGFFDPEITEEDLPFVEYEIIGYYARIAEDPIREYFGELRDAIANQEINERDVLRDFNLHHDLSCPELTAEIAGMLCVSKVQFSQNPDINLAFDPKEISISVGVSGPETLSSRVAEKVLKKRKGAESVSKKELREWEKRLEALQLFPRLVEESQDLGPRFNELRHDLEFTQEFGGVYWAIAEQNQVDQLTPENPQNKQNVPKKQIVPQILKEKLDQLNTLQTQFDDLAFRVNEMEKQLFADWYKYVQSIYPTDWMHHVYPDLEMVRYFIRECSARPLEARQDSLRAIESNVQFVLQELTQEIRLFNLETATRNLDRQLLQLQGLPEPGYFLPREPIVLIEGAAAGKGQIQEPAPYCAVIELDENVNTWEKPETILETIGKIPTQEKQKWNFQPWESQPWSPYFLEWEVSFLPTNEGSNFSGNEGSAASEFYKYDPDYLTQGYYPPFAHPGNQDDPDLQDSPDWELVAGKGKVSPTLKSYSGRTFLSPTDNETLQFRIEEFLKKHIQLSETEMAQIKAGNVQAVIQQYQGLEGDPLRFYLEVFSELLATPFLSQGLGGFNLGLLQRKHTQDLPVDDPVNFSLFRNFSTNIIASLVGNSRKEAPMPLQYFHPFRAGCMRIRRLGLLDSFGRMYQPDLESLEMHLPTRLQIPYNPRLIKLLPRLAQPSRIHLKWRNATAIQNPIGGWVVLNRVNHSLMLFEQDGKLIGQITGQEWIGDRITLSLPDFTGAEIQHPDLQKFAMQLKAEILRTGDGFDLLIQKLESALENIRPEAWLQPGTSTLLAGRPLAVIRATLKLELKGGLMNNQSWRSFEADMNAFLATNPQERQADPEKLYRERDKSGYENVEIQVQAGASEQMNDGLAAFLMEVEDQAGNYAYADDIQFIQGRNVPRISLTPEGPHASFTCLVDPLGEVHFTSGILPMLGVQIPQRYYEDAIKNLGFVSLPMPVLTPADQLRLPLEHNPDSDWIWTWEDENHQVFEVDTVGWIEQNRFFEFAANAEFIQNPAHFLSPELIWEALIDRKWLISTGEFWVRNQQGKTGKIEFPACPMEPPQLEEKIARLLDAAETRIRKVKYEAEVNNTPQIIREGRIKLKPKR